MAKTILQRIVLSAALAGSMWVSLPADTGAAEQAAAPSTPVVRVTQPSERLTMIVGTSRVLQLDKKIPQINLNNRDVLAAVPLSPNQIHLVAKKPGSTQIHLWDENQQIYTVDVTVLDDAKEVSELLSSEFPSAVVRVRPFAGKVLLSGQVDRPQDADQIKRIVEEYYGTDRVIANLSVVGVQQVLLHIKVYEVSRTKLRSMSFDWAHVSNGGFVSSGVSQLIKAGSQGVTDGIRASTGQGTVAFKVTDGGSYFFGVLEALRQDNLAKVLSEPTLVTSSGRPAVFLVGGEIPYLVPQGLASSTIEWKSYGTRIDFVPIVLGNGSIRLEVRPEVSEIDSSRNQVDGVPALKISYVDTGVTIQAGQTLAIAGLVQRKTEAQRRGLPLVCDVPYLGVLFSAKREEVNEIESLILVTPELVDPLAGNEVSPCGPGTRTASPGDWDLYMKGVIETPNPCPPCNGNPCVQPPYGPAMPQGPEVVPTPDPRMPGTPSRSTLEPQTAFRTRPQATLVSTPVNRYNPSSPTVPATRPAAATRPGQMPGYRGPVGYDAE